jgi:hypothetical protein
MRERNSNWSLKAIAESGKKNILDTVKKKLSSK